MTASYPPAQPRHPKRETPPPPGRPQPPRPKSDPPKKNQLLAAEELYSVVEVAAIWDCSRQHVYDVIAAKQLRTVDIGLKAAKTRVPASALVEFQDRRTRSTPR